ncbi:JAB domain-containing protein [Rhodohalobacter sp. 8-1]|uniref:JAB domain-containing protein n=1 Tax=Rhodohalobacter sp. 8-1 TaxID=3131972 RepID=UPI0030EE3244
MPTVAEITLSYKPAKPVSELPCITCPEDAAAYCHSIWDDDLLELREQFIVVLLNNQKQVLGWHLISSGGATATIVEIAAIYQAALLGNAHSLIFSHSHPSSNPRPSNADIKLTKRAVDAGKLLGIAVDDHIILYRGGYTSFRNKGLI